MSGLIVPLTINVDSSFPQAFLELVEARLGAFPELIDLVERSLVGRFPLNYVDITFILAPGASNPVMSVQPSEGLSLLMTALSAYQIDVNRVQEIFHSFLLSDGVKADYPMTSATAARPDEQELT